MLSYSHGLGDDRLQGGNMGENMIIHSLLDRLDCALRNLSFREP